MARYDPSDEEWRLVEPLLPRPCKGKHLVDDRRVAAFSGISRLPDVEGEKTPVECPQ